MEATLDANVEVSACWVDEIRTVSPLKDLFGIRQTVLDAITSDIQKNGFDNTQPLILWLGNKRTLVDGHTRLEAARLAGLKKVPVMFKDFTDEAAALKYAIKCQRNRRNLTAAEIMACIAEVDKLKDKGGDKGNQYTGGKVAIAPCGANGKSAQDTAEVVGVSPRTVERARTVIDSATPEIKQAVESGDMTINAAYNATVAARKPIEPLDAAAEELAKLDKIVNIILERLTNDQIAKLIIRLQTEITN